MFVNINFSHIEIQRTSPIPKNIVYVVLMLHRNKNDRIDLHISIVKLKYTSIFVFYYVYLYDFIIRYPIIYIQVGIYITNVFFWGIEHSN